MYKSISLAAYFYAAFSVAASQTVTLKVPTSYLQHPEMMQQFDEAAIRQLVPDVILSASTDHNGVTTENSKVLAGGSVVERKVIKSDGDLSIVEFVVNTDAANGLLQAKAENHKLHQELMSISDNLIPDHNITSLQQQATQQRKAATIDGNLDAIIQTTNNEKLANELRDCPISMSPEIISLQVTPARAGESNVALTFKLNNIYDPCGNDPSSVYRGHSGHIVVTIGKNRFSGAISVKPQKKEYEIYKLTAWNWGDNFMSARVNQLTDFSQSFRREKIIPYSYGQTRYTINMDGNNTFTLNANRVSNDSLFETSKPILVFVP